MSELSSILDGGCIYNTGGCKLGWPQGANDATAPSRPFQVLRQRMSVIAVLVFLLFGPMNSWGSAQTDSSPSTFDEIQSVDVVLDGKPIFPVQGIPSYPASERARGIENRLKKLAASEEFSPDRFTFAEKDQLTIILYDDHMVFGVHDLDAEAQGVGRAVLASLAKDKVVSAIQTYREERMPRNLIIRTGLAILATILLASIVFLIWKFARRQQTWLERRYRSKIGDVQFRSMQLVQAERLWAAVRGIVQGGRTLLTLFLVLAWLEYALHLFPWTRPIADQALVLILTPLKIMGQGIVKSIPGLLFIVVLAILVRYLLKLLRLFFAGVENRTIQISGFDPDWSWPTYKILRLGLIVCAVIVAYPYIPGADTAAFKGVSLFLGVIFSLGSSSAISNIIAGYMLTYRRAFKVGDWVKIGDNMGNVLQIRHQVTHLRSFKNEEVIIPNSSILNSQVINYSSLARQHGLILHTTVGIGYETPWRQVEAMLVLAAERTPGLLQEPRPFVLQKVLGDFCVTYELNVYTEEPQERMKLYTELHRNILDVFNEFKIQIMTPAYVGDPDQPKIVPRGHWFDVPADSSDKGASLVEDLAGSTPLEEDG